ncbi:GNAT family N-acetyltransferase [uncultured Ferrovibrio sp.]|jgi:ribosomal-protein-alanine N-acetyltransferase|uniref:GNAT family N-acetyltransferase n=1 Tax=uncultured Ferrovibrio sp. TaxID=1576913 RepID=UPI0026087BA7|nr:GNAT family N-acetyltransferase [uncultured Ferrovibrio sp.]
MAEEKRAEAIQTEHLLLLPFAADDCDELLALFQHPAVRRDLCDDKIMPREWMEQEIAASEARFAQGALGLWSLRLRSLRLRAAQNGAFRIIGIAGFLPVRGVLQLMYALLPDYRRRGYATEAATAAIEIAKRCGRHTVVAATDIPNVASQQVLLRLGFRETARNDGLVAFEKRL